MPYTNKGIVMRMIILTTFVVVLNMFKYLNYLDLVQIRDYTRAYIGRMFGCLACFMDFTGIYVFAFLNMIVIPLVCNTGVSWLISIGMLTSTMPRIVRFVMPDVFHVHALLVQLSTLFML